MVYTVEDFIRLLSSEDDNERRLAAEWLADYGGDPGSFEPLVKLLQDGEQSHEILLYSVLALARIQTPEAFSLVLSLLNDPTGSLRDAAAQALGKSGNSAAFAPLVRHLADSDARVRAMVIFGLGRLGDRGAVPLLIPMLNDPDDYVQICTIGALGELRDPQAVPMLIQMLNHVDYYQREQAARALGLIGDLRSIPALAERAEHDLDKSVRKAAAKALTRLQPPASD